MWNKLLVCRSRLFAPLEVFTPLEVSPKLPLRLWWGRGCIVAIGGAPPWLVPVAWQGFRWLFALLGPSQSFRRDYGCFLGRYFLYLIGVWEKFDYVGVAPVASIVLKHWTKVPPQLSVRILTSLLALFLMHDHFGAWGHEWVAIVVKGSKECLAGRYAGLCSQSSQKVKGDLCLG
jgi:hypothetical protein